MIYYNHLVRYAYNVCLTGSYITTEMEVLCHANTQ